MTPQTKELRLIFSFSKSGETTPHNSLLTCGKLQAATCDIPLDPLVTLGGSREREVQNHHHCQEYLTT